ncbi:MAG: glycine cleavage system protein GcvH [Acidipropionibacterium acidipropionici]|jgi:glycine cleavage system H protein|uniref:Glycine cleavage system H protein n=2 Tax=Acidipropionibacterium acidipropionici TaxID=1748 RepID=A0A142KKY8_9ACTN|nr:glycine cleavage system protein GcvH [Acidipropionibacterium acidipropionici]AFV89092.1 Glycine cleavage system H protein [Acidipropionibacterium acidipropionici ATCC 4875]ALN16334.1 glycine cleavage system protein H [Acidipropionibacterium acidipropionici]AMS06776.1 glycine cleavage system protein H [Acidipropionibacterium acidipropionici]AOZ45564.1 glycine cleavage system protein H [Acidipropionibacterium acidipropionici]APZ07920.1 glycine cleavage system protein H [Acidipropionibacterium
MELTDLKYSKEHEWVALDPATGVATVGITDFAGEQLGDVVFVQLPGEGDELAAGQAIGEVESTKSVSDLFSPVSGTVSEVNAEIEDSPELVNSDPFGKGWLFKVADAQVPDDLLDRSAYLELTAD